MHIYILRGVSGSGKSTLVKEMTLKQETFEIDWVSADNYFMREGVYAFDPSKLSEAHGECLRNFIKLVQMGVDVVVDNTNTSIAEIAPYAAIALAYGAELDIITLDVPWEVAAARNTHGVPAAAVERMAANLAKGTAEMPPWWPHRVVTR